MSETKHTPGEWSILDLRESDRPRLCIVTPGRKDFVIARIQNEVSGQPISEEDLANARLIAAAPDMFEALKDLTDSAKLVSDYVTKTEDIQGAEMSVSLIRDELEPHITKARAALAKARK